MEALVGYVSTNDRIRHSENSGGGAKKQQQRLGHVTTNCRGSSWDPDRGDTREPPGLNDEEEEDATAVVVFGSGRTLQRCTCSSGKCRHHQTTTTTMTGDGSGREEAVECVEVMEQEVESVDVEEDHTAVPPRNSPSFPSPDESKTQPTVVVGSPLPAFSAKRTTK